MRTVSVVVPTLAIHHYVKQFCSSVQCGCGERTAEGALLGLRRVGRVYRRHRRAARRADLLQVAGAVEVQATLSDTSDWYIYAPTAHRVSSHGASVC